MEKKEKNTAKLFSGALIREGFLQLKLIGILYVCIIAASSVLIPLFDMGTYVSEMELSTLTTFIPAGILFGLPILTFYLFRFLTDRSGSDFYHSLPYRRSCLFGSFAAAVYLWFLLLLAENLLLGGLMVLALPKLTFHFDLQAVLLVIQYLLAALLSLAVSLLAVSLTGTTLTNIAAAAMIGFVPRFLLYILNLAVAENVPYLIENSGTGILSARLNLLVTSFLQIFQGENISADPRACLYSLLLAAVYLLLAGWFFQKRASESAGQTGLNGFLRLLFRLIPAFLICLVPLMNMISEAGASSPWELFCEDPKEYILYYIIAVLFYLTYELITTRQLSRVLRALPGLAALVLLNVLFYCAALFGISRASVFDAPAVTGVQLLDSDYTDISYFNYAERKAGNVVFTDPEIVSLLTEAMEETIHNTSLFERVRYDQEEYETRSVAFRSGSGLFARVQNRSVVLTREQEEKLEDLIFADESYRECFLGLPSEDQVTGIVFSFDIQPESEEELSAFYEECRRMIRETGFDDWYAQLRDVKYGETSAIAWIYFSGGGYLTVPFTLQDTDGTYLIYKTAQESLEANHEEVSGLLDKSAEELSEYSGSCIRLSFYQDGLYDRYTSALFAEDDYSLWEECRDLYQLCADAQDKGTGSFLVEIEIYTASEDGQAELLLPVSQENYEKWIAIAKESEN